MSSNAIRFTGLASGMDTESLVKAMMMRQQQKIDKQTKKEQLYTWKQESWKDMNSKISKFREKYIDKLRMQSTFLKTNITTSNDAAISINSSSAISQGSHMVEIKQMATSAYMETKTVTATVQPLYEDMGMKLSELGINKETKLRIHTETPEMIEEIVISPTNTLEELKTKLGEKGIDLKVNANKLSLEGSATSNVELIVVDNDTDNNVDTWSGDTSFLSKLGFASGQKVAIEAGKEIVGSEIRKNTLSGTTTLDTLKSGSSLLVTGDLEIQVNGKAVTLKSTMTINDMISAMKKADSNLAISFDNTVGQFFVNSTITGINSKTNITSPDGSANTLLNVLGLADASGNTYNGTTTQGVNAQYKYNGMGSNANNADPYFESESNEVSVNGIQMTFKQAGTGPITIQGSSNTEEIVNFVKEFVTEYNSLLEDLNTKLKTKTKSTYEPLTDEEKENASEANIEKIETYVKDGLFYRDSSLMELRETLRNTLGEVFEDNSQYKTLYSVGIKTGDWKEDGKLYLDEAALTKALKDKPEEVRNLFAGAGSERSNQGIFTRINDTFSAMSKSTDFRSYGSFYNDKEVIEQLKMTADKIYDLNQQYSRQETALYKKFTAMEKMISQLNNQQTALTNMLGQN